MLNCKCGDTDLSLVSYVELGEGMFEATFECRQCGRTFSVPLTEAELSEYR